MMPAWARTIGLLRDERVQVRAICTVCPAFRDIDLGPLIAAKGADYSLINRRCRCRLTIGCSGWNRFLFQAHGRMRGLWDEETALRWALR